jgi:hypothetical protein
MPISCEIAETYEGLLWYLTRGVSMSLIWAFWCRTGSGGRLLLVMGGGESIVGGGDASRSPRVATVSEGAEIC